MTRRRIYLVGMRYIPFAGGGINCISPSYTIFGQSSGTERYISRFPRGINRRQLKWLFEEED